MPRVRLPAGHTLLKCLHKSEWSEVYAAQRTSDGREIVLKAYLEDVDADGEPRIRREYEIMKQFTGPGIAAPLDLLAGDGSTAPTLVLERLPGVRFADWVASGPVAVEAFLEVGLQLAAALGRLHAARLVHYDVSATTILVDPATLQAWLIDFELTRSLGSAVRSGGERRGSRRMGTPAYMAPEQTGRMDRGSDSRSDLYSLGACFYHALTGRPPFEGKDRLAVVHGHIARLPIAPIELRPALPPTLSRIVLKLLQKSPEDRYQTAHALHVDLAECRDQLQRHGRISSDFPLGSADVPYRPLFGDKLHGREAQMGVLLDAYQTAARGESRFVLLRGAPGAGKSALVHSLHAPVTRGGGYLTQGKFDLYRRVPYAAFIPAFESLIDQLLTESDAALAHWRSCLVEGLGAIARALCDLVPSLALVMGDDLPPVPPLGHAETRARLSLAVRRFLRAMATPNHPLVLFLDDLQWADTASRELLRDLLLQAEPAGALLVLGTYRDTEVGPEHPLAHLLEELAQRGAQGTTLEIGPLAPEACAAMLGDALGRPAEQMGSLAACVAHKTGSAPLLIQQFVEHMYGAGLIYFEPGTGWTWDERALLSADISDDAVELMMEKIGRLEPAVAQVLELASCGGDVFDLDLLIEFSERRRAELEPALFQLCDEGLIAPAPSGFRFCHDRIREAAQVLLSESERTRLHYDAARHLLARTPPETLAERAFEIADHFNLGGELLDETTRPRAIELNLLAGKRALRAGASGTATPYLDMARTLFERARWEDDPALGFDLFLQSAEAAYQERNFPLALELLARLERQPLAPLQSAIVAAKTIAVHHLELNGQRVVPLVLAALRRLGVRWPAFPSRLRTRLTLAWTDWLLAGPLDERTLRPAPPGDHGRTLGPLLICAAGGAAMALHSLRLPCLSTSFALRMHRRLGYFQSPGLVLGAYASARLAYLHHLRGAARYADAALAWADRVPHVPFSPRARFIVHACVYSWTQPRRSVLEPLRRIRETMLETGDIEYAYYCFLQRTIFLAQSGEPLANVVRELAAFDMHRDRNTATQTQALAMLCDAGADPDALRAEVLKLQLDRDPHPSATMQPWAFWLGVACALGHHADVFAIAERIWDRAWEKGATHSQIADGAFFAAISAAELAAGRGGGRKRARRVLRRNLRHLRVWARGGPDFGHMVQGLEAEEARLAGRHRLALKRYAEAADAAAGRGYVHHAGLLLERRAEFLHALGRRIEAKSSWTEALAFYAEWGAQMKVARLQAQAAPGARAAGPH